MHLWPALILLIFATAATGLLAGASLDQSIKQLPSRRRIGVAAFARYSQAADLSNGIAFYASLGLAVLLLNIGAAIAVYVESLAMALTLAVYAGACLAIFHSIVTVAAARTNFSQRSVTDQTKLAVIFDRFARLQAMRCALQVLNFGANLWAIGTAIAS
jgi:hypothetical protein